MTKKIVERAPEINCPRYGNRCACGKKNSPDFNKCDKQILLPQLNIGTSCFQGPWAEMGGTIFPSPKSFLLTFFDKKVSPAQAAQDKLMVFARISPSNTCAAGART